MLDHEFKRYKVAVWFSRKVLVSIPVAIAAYLFHIQAPHETYGVLILVSLQNWFIWRLLGRLI